VISVKLLVWVVLAKKLIAQAVIKTKIIQIWTTSGKINALNSALVEQRASLECVFHVHPHAKHVQDLQLSV
jgi:hypothetical protein